MVKKSFEDALKPHYNDALRYSKAICADWSADEAEDVLQQALLNAFEHFEDLREPDKFKSWLFSIITRTFFKATKRHFWRRFVPLPDTARGEFPPLLSQHRSSEDIVDLLNAISTLSSRERATLLLHEVGGFTLGEIAPMTGDNSVSAVKSRMSRCRKKLVRAVSRISGSRKRSGAGSENIEDETIRLVKEYGQRSRSER